MIAIGRYFVFIVLMTGTILSAHNFSEEGELIFYDAYQNENNEIKNKSPYFFIKIDMFSSGRVFFKFIFTCI